MAECGNEVADPLGSADDLLRRAEIHKQFFRDTRAEVNALYLRMKAFFRERHKLDHPLYAEFNGADGNWPCFERLIAQFELHVADFQAEVIEIAIAVGQTPPATGPGHAFFKTLLTEATQRPESEHECFMRVETLQSAIGEAQGRELLRAALRKHYCVYTAGMIVSIGASIHKAAELHRLIASFKLRTQQFAVEAQPLLRMLGEQAATIRSRFEQFLTQLRTNFRNLPNETLQPHIARVVVEQSFGKFYSDHVHHPATLLEAGLCLASAYARLAEVPIEAALPTCLSDFRAQQAREQHISLSVQVAELIRFSNAGRLAPHLIDEESIRRAQTKSFCTPALAGMVQKLLAHSKLHRVSENQSLLFDSTVAAETIEAEGHVDFARLHKCVHLYQSFLRASASPAEEELQLNKHLLFALELGQTLDDEALSRDLTHLLGINSRMTESNAKHFVAREAELIDLKARVGRYGRSCDRLCEQWQRLAVFQAPMARLFLALSARVSQCLSFLKNIFRLARASADSLANTYAATGNFSRLTVHPDDLHPQELLAQLKTIPLASEKVLLRLHE